MKINTVLGNSLVAIAGFSLLFLSAASFAQVRIGTASVPLSYSGPESLFLGASVSTGTVGFPLGGGTAPGTVSITTEYTLNQGRVLTIEAGFNSAIALTDGVGDQIPTQAISANFSSSDGGMVNNFGSCNGPASGQTQIFSSSCGYISYSPVVLGQTNGTHFDTMALSLNPAFSAPGTYTGILLISAQAN